MKKVFFDTNFLLRFYLDDIPTQALKAKRIVQAAKEGGILLVTDLIVICEMVWVLDSYYNLGRELISEILPMPSWRAVQQKTMLSIWHHSIKSI